MLTVTSSIQGREKSDRRIFRVKIYELVDKGKGKGQVLDIALLHDEHMLRSAFTILEVQLIGMS